MHTEVTVDIDAPPQQVWDVIEDVERWPEWTASINHVDKLYEGPLSVGARARIAQPKVPLAVWTVTRLDRGRFFEWETSSPAIHSVAGHRVEPHGDGSRVTLTIEQTGLFASLLGFWIKRISEKYVGMEASGLKTRSEALAKAA
jgi:uncharacterized membrane protein